jgi:hypothetical protein
MPQSAIDIITPIYRQLVDAERSGGIEASKKILNGLLEEHHVGYREFIINLQLGATL